MNSCVTSSTFVKHHSLFFIRMSPSSYVQIMFRSNNMTTKVIICTVPYWPRMCICRIKWSFQSALYAGGFGSFEPSTSLCMFKCDLYIANSWSHYPFFFSKVPHHSRGHSSFLSHPRLSVEGSRWTLKFEHNGWADGWNQNTTDLSLRGIERNGNNAEA